MYWLLHINVITTYHSFRGTGKNDNLWINNKINYLYFHIFVIYKIMWPQSLLTRQYRESMFSYLRSGTLGSRDYLLVLTDRVNFNCRYQPDCSIRSMMVVCCTDKEKFFPCQHGRHRSLEPASTEGPSICSHWTS